MRQELVGPKIIDFESSVTSLAPEEIQKTKEKYIQFVQAALDGPLKAPPPQNRDELLELCRKVLSFIWSRFQYSGMILLTDSVNSGKLDCDASCFLAADMLSQFGVGSELVALPNHLNLKVSCDGISFYLDTTSKAENVQVYGTYEELRREYSIINGRCKFSAENFVLYHNRGNAKSKRGDYKGAVEEDYNRAMELEPGCAELQAACQIGSFVAVYEKKAKSGVERL